MPRVLILTNYFFPNWRVNAIRPTQWARFLPQHHWTPVVVSRFCEDPSFATTHAAQVHPQVELHYLVNCAEHPSRLATTSKWIALRQRLGRTVFSKFIVPDVQVRFWRSRQRELLKLVARTKPDVLLTTSPPHSTHFAGRWLGQQTGIPWVADFRDPYLFDRRFRPRGVAVLATSAHERFERSIYEDAAAIIHAIPAHADWARTRYRDTAEKIFTITNGFPPELVDGSIRPSTSLEGRHSIRIIGFCGQAELITIALAVRGLVSRGHDLELRIVGDPPANLAAARSILGARLISVGKVLHTDALREVLGADVLVSALSLHRSRNQLLSSKLFEFIASGKPILQINPSDPDVQFTRQVDGIETLRQPSVTDVEKAVLTCLKKTSTPDANRKEFLRTFNRAAQTKLLASILERVLPSSG